MTGAPSIGNALLETSRPHLDAVWTPSVQQQVYRCVLQASAYAGSIQQVPAIHQPAPVWLAVLASLVDHSVSLHDLSQRIDSKQLSFLGCTQGSWSTSGFILASGTQAPPDEMPQLGSLVEPELGATLVIVIKDAHSLDHSADAAAAVQSTEQLTLTLSGPGIASTTTCAVNGLHRDWLTARTSWCAGYPCGVDLLLTTEHSVIAIPRTTQVKLAGTTMNSRGI